MLTAPEESELRAIKDLARSCQRVTNNVLFSALADRLDNFIEEHGEAAWRRRVSHQPLPVVAPQ